MSNFSDRLKALRTAKGITQKELAHLLHVSQNAIHNWETGKREPKIETINNIAVALGVDYSQLIDMRKIPITKDLIISRPDIKEILTNFLLELFKCFGHDVDQKFIDFIKDDTSQEIIDTFNTFIENLEINDKYKQVSINLADPAKNLIMIYYDRLNHNGRLEALKRMEELAELPQYTKKEADKPLPMVNAAHEIENSSEADKNHDEDIMNDENF